MKEMSFGELFGVMLKKWWLILAFTLVAGGFAAAYTFLWLTPAYEANAMLYVGKNAAEQGLNETDLYIGQLVIQDYSEIATSRAIAASVIKELGIDYMDPAVLSRNVSIAQKADTRVIQISVRDPDPELAMLIANKEAEVFRDKVVQIMQVENVQIIDTATLPTTPVWPNSRMNILIGLIFGLLTGVSLVLILAYFDNTVKTPDDVKKYVELPVIGTVPEFRRDERSMKNVG